MNEVFISYSHADIDFLNDFKRHLKPFRNKINFWDDSQILAGNKWKDEILKALDSCKIAILFISADFFNSDFISNEELPKLLHAATTRGTEILSVILKPCLFSEYPEINQYQAINSPSKTIIQMTDAEREEVWIKLALRIKKVMGVA